MANSFLKFDGNSSPINQNKAVVFIVVMFCVSVLSSLIYWTLPSSDSGASVNPNIEHITGDATYVPMPRPFTFNLQDGSRDRVVQIKVQLLIRGTDNQINVRKHIPLIEDTLLKNFSQSSASQLKTAEGKAQLRQQALLAVQQTLQQNLGSPSVERVLFTGFIMQ
ncbi:flagellar basal body-associated FliL family protein [Paraferrimonas sp. SM1919]|uniref:flagellar basal body-associated FliL family protein n=1 Tax=Paraferrimonas sp. SM1919 TaxID=2662263 RepID=UPI0013D114F5|nr:flagellar basal body-associated FliL family protein [Paraferrimonas sp. SM1919]